MQASAEPELDLNRLSVAILEETNRERASHGLVSLRADGRLVSAADNHAKFLALIATLSHESFLPGRRTVGDRVRAEGVKSPHVSENLAIVPLRGFVLREREKEPGSIETSVVDLRPGGIEAIAREVVRNWMNSPGHRANLLNPNFTHLGCAVRTGVGPTSGTLAYSAQVFARL